MQNKIQNKDLQLVLKQFGLTSVEVEIYLILLELGPSPVSTIAKKGHLKRTNLYNILTKLIQQGLISEFQKGHVRFFHGTEPQQLIYLQEQRKKKIELNIERLKEIVPALEGMQNPMLIKPKVRFYQGEEGIGTLLNEIINNEAFDGYFNPEITYKYYPHIVDNFLENGQKKSLHIRELMTPSNTTNAYVKRIKNPNHQCKILPKKHHFSSDNFIFGNKVAFISYLEGSIAVVIESEDIAHTQKITFDLMWNAIQ